jgi:hypothetical protein
MNTTSSADFLIWAAMCSTMYGTYKKVGRVRRDFEDASLTGDSQNSKHSSHPGTARI